MAQVTFSPEARGDLLEIVDYLLKIAGRHTARKYDARIKRVIENLEDFPEIGPLRPEAGAGVRMLVVRPYLILYSQEPHTGEVLILRILHGARNIDEDLVRPRSK